MSKGFRCGQDRHRPAGKWVIATPVLEVMGEKYRSRDANAFTDAVIKAEAKGWLYGVRLEPEPDNPHGAQAIKVIGWAQRKSWLFGQSEPSWHVGYVPKEFCAEIHADFLDRDIPIAAELYSIYRGGHGDGYIDIKFLVLAPPGNSESARRRRAKPTAGI